MLIDCPNCARSYHVSTASLGEAGRKMRCASCRRVWHAAAPGHQGGIDRMAARALDEAGLEINAVATSERSAPPDFEELYGATPLLPRAKPQGTPWKLPRPPAGLMLGVLAMVLSMGLVAKREAVVRLVPAGAQVFAAIGLPVNLRGLEFRHITSTLMGEGPQRVLAIEGEIANIGRASATVPELQLALKAADGREIYGWTANAPKSRLDGGEIMQFRARLAAPPEKARDTVVRFATAPARIREARK